MNSCLWRWVVWCWGVVVFFLVKRNSGEMHACFELDDRNNMTTILLRRNTTQNYCTLLFMVFLPGRVRYHEIIFHNGLLFCGDQIYFNFAKNSIESIATDSTFQNQCFRTFSGITHPAMDSFLLWTYTLYCSCHSCPSNITKPCWALPTTSHHN